MADGFLMNEIFVANCGGAGVRVGVMDGNASGATNENSRITNSFFQACGTKAIWIETDQASLQGTQQIVNCDFDNIQISAPANEAIWFKMICPGGVSFRNIMLTAGPTGTVNTYSAFKFSGAYGGLLGVTIDTVGAAASQNWKYIFDFSGSGAYGANNLIRNYQNNAALTAVFSLDANCGCRVEDVLTTTGLSGYVQPNATGIASVVFSGAGIKGLVGGSYQAAGLAGEVLSVFTLFGSQVALTTAVTANIASLLLTKGNWLVSGKVHYHGANTTVVSATESAIAQTSATLPSRDLGRTVSNAVQFSTNVTDESQAIGAFVLSLSADTTFYLVANAVFTTSTLAAYGDIIAVRLP